MSVSYSLHQGKKKFLTTSGDEIYNKNGAILFTTDTNELFININDISSENTLTNRKQVNSLYSTAIISRDENNQILEPKFDYTILNEMKKITDAQAGKLDGKMDIKNPKGTGNFTIGNTNTFNKNSENSALIGNGLQQGENNSNSIICGKYNIAVKDALLVIGNGTQGNGSNVFIVTPTFSSFNQNLYINTGNTINSKPDKDDNRVLTKSEIEKEITAAEDKLQKNINNLSPRPFLSSIDPPDKNVTDKNELTKIHNLFWINTSKGQGVLNYWKPNTIGDGGSWIEVSAIFT